VQLNFLKDFETMYKNKRRFSFGFHGDLSHDSNKPLNLVDDELKEWLENLYNGGLLNNTLFLLMSDHGARFQHLRETVQGNMEERNPFFAVRLPPSFKTKYPGAYKNLLSNAKRLTTPYDIHATFHDILDFCSVSRGAVSKRGISLFSLIPSERTCAHAQIAPHWCNCMHWATIKTDSIEVIKAAKSFVELVNVLTEQVRDECIKVELDKVLEANVMTPNKKLPKNAKISMKQNTNIKLFQLVVHTKPGGGHFEATVKHDVGNGAFISNVKDVSRTNAYGKDPDCVASRFPHLVRFCYCKVS
jgi:hypothetical protein